MVQGFCPLVTPTSGGFRLKVSSSSSHLHPLHLCTKWAKQFKKDQSKRKNVYFMWICFSLHLEFLSGKEQKSEKCWTEDMSHIIINLEMRPETGWIIGVQMDVQWRTGVPKGGCLFYWVRHIFCLTDVHVSDGPELELKSGITFNENW